MKFDVSDPFRQEISHNQNNNNPQQNYNNNYHQNYQQNYNNNYNSTGYQDPMTDDRFRRPDFDNQPYDRTSFRLNEMEKHHEETQLNSSGPKSALFLLWFFCSIAGIVISLMAEINPGVAMILFGQVFAGGGILGFIQKKCKLENLMILIFPLIGLGLIIGGLISLFGDKNLIEIAQIASPYIIFIVTILIGIGMLTYPSFVEKKILQRCTVPVKAKVVDLIKQHTRKGGRIYTPVYEYCYNRRTFRQRDKTATNANVPKIGDEMEGYVNPDDPSELYVIWKGRNAINRTIGWILIIFPPLYALLDIVVLYTS